MSKKNRNIILIALCLLHFCLSNYLSYKVLDHTPHIPDGVCYLFQAKIFQAGRLFAPAPQVPKFMVYSPIIIRDGKWYSQYPPGYPLLLLLGLLLKAPWLVNPTLGALSTLLIGLIGETYYDRRTGILSALFASLSPFVLFMSSNFMSHTSAMFWLCLFLLYYKRGLLDDGGSFRAAISGLALGFAFITRPLTAVGLSAPFLAYAGYALLKERKTRQVLGFVVACVVPVLFLLFYNYRTNGGPFIFGYVVNYGTAHLPGFHKTAGLWGVKEHTLHRAASLFIRQIVLLSQELFGWPVPDLALCIAPFLLFRKARRVDFLLALGFLSLNAAYSTYFYLDGLFGPRYMFSAVPLIAVLSARGILILHVTMNWQSAWASVTARAAFWIAVALFFGYSTTRHIPALIERYSHNYVGGKNYPEKMLRRTHLSNAIVFLNSNNAMAVHGHIYLHNSVFLKDSVLFAEDLGTLNEAFVRLYPGRLVYRYKYYYVGSWASSEMVFEELTRINVHRQ